MEMEGDSLNPFALWAKSIGLTPYERTSIRDGSGRSYRSSRRRRRHNGDTANHSSATDEDDELNPSFHSTRRSSSLLAATLQLIGSALGAGIIFLFLPSPSNGQVPSQNVLTNQHTMWAMVAALFFTERSVCLTMLNSRYAGVNNAPDLVRVALGPMIHRLHAIGSFGFHLALLVCLQMLILEVGHSIMQEFDTLLTTLWENYDGHTRQRRSLEERNLLPLFLATFGCVLVVSPTFFQREFRWIRTHLVTILITTLILATSTHFASISSNEAGNQHNNSSNSQHGSSMLLFDWLLLILFPPQALKAQNTLRHPTRRRVGWVVSLSVACTIIVLILLGHTVALMDHRIYKKANEVGPIVSAIPVVYAMIGRVGCVVSLLLTYGLQLPLTRRNALHIIEFAFIDKSDPNQCRLVKDICPDECCDEDAEDEETCVSFPSISTWSTSKSHVDVIQLAPDEETTLLPRIEEGLEPCNVYTNAFAHYSSTTGIVLVSFGLACLLYTAKISAWSIWQWIAALFAPWFALAVPAACFLRIQGRQAFLPWRVPWIGFAYISIFVAGAASLVATVQLFFDDILSTPTISSFINDIVFMMQ